MKKVLIFLFIFLFAGCIQPARAIYGDYDEFDSQISEEASLPAVIPKGSFFRGFIGQMVSSEYNNDGDIVKILITADFLLNRRIILPKNSVFWGKIKGLQKAQQGMDGVFSIDIIALSYPDGRQFPVKGYVVSKGDKRVFGGEFSKRTGHRDVLHRSECFSKKGVLQLLQNGPRAVGKETKIAMGDLVTILIEDEIKLD